jgi:HJR/Mrr/RecB family endonuclease
METYILLINFRVLMYNFSRKDLEESDRGKFKPCPRRVFKVAVHVMFVYSMIILFQSLKNSK